MADGEARFVGQAPGRGALWAGTLSPAAGNRRNCGTSESAWMSF